MTTYKFRHEGQTCGPYTMQQVAALDPASPEGVAATEGEPLESTGWADIDGHMVYEGDHVDVFVREGPGGRLYGGATATVGAVVEWTGGAWAYRITRGSGRLQTGLLGPVDAYFCKLTHTR